MCSTIKLPFHVERVDNLAKVINDEISQINVLIRQLDKHAKEIQSLKENRPVLNLQVLNLTRFRDDAESDRNACCLTLAKLDALDAETALSEVKKKFRIYRLKQNCRAKLKVSQSRLDIAQFNLQVKTALLQQSSKENIERKEENYKSHLKQLYNTVHEYKLNSDSLRAMTGVVLPSIDPSEFLETKEEQMPTVKVVKQFPTIEIETPHCVVVCE